MTHHAPVPRWVRALLVPTALLSLLWILLPTPAEAHATLVGTSPADQEVLEESPEVITLTFSEPVRPTDGITVVTGAGDPVPATVEALDAVVSITPSEPLEEGTYVVGWRVVSADSHPISGGFSFSVGEPSGSAVQMPPSSASREVALVRLVTEGVRYAGVLTGAGLVAWAAVVVPGASPVVRRRTRRVALGAALMGVLSGLVLAPVTALGQAGEPLSALGGVLVDPTTWLSSATGAAGLSLALLVAAALMWTRPVPATSAAALGLGSLALGGHTRTFGPPWLVVGSDLVHVAAGALWVGGLVGLLVLFAPASGAEPHEMQRGVRRFSAVALWTVAALGLSGVLLWWRIPGTITGLVDSSYGWHLIAKVALVAVVVLIASFNLRHLRSRRRADIGRLRRTVGAEAAVLAVVLGVTGSLVTQSPTVAEPPPAAAPVARTMELSEGYSAEVTFVPGEVGTNSVEVEVVDDAGMPVEALDPPQLSLTLEDAGLGPFRHELNATGPGSYEGVVDLPIAGRWDVRLAVRVSRFDQPAGTMTLEVE